VRARPMYPGVRQSSEQNRAERNAEKQAVRFATSV
jgi:hypothetical protein